MRRTILLMGDPGSGFPGGAEDIRDQWLCKPAACILAEGKNRRTDGSQMAGAFGEQEDAEQAHDREVQPVRGAPSHLLIDQDGIRGQFHGDGDGLGFAGVEVGGAQGIGDGEWGADFEPSGKDGVGAFQLGEDCGRDDDLPEKRGQQVRKARLQEGGDRRGVADDEHRLAGKEFLDGDEILGEVFLSVVHGDFAATEFMEELRLAEVGDFGGLAEGDFAGAVKPDGEVQGGAALGERGFQRSRQCDVHGGRKVALETGDGNGLTEGRMIRGMKIFASKL